MSTVGRILAVPGLEPNTSAAFRRLLWDMCERNGWDVDAIAAVISHESGFQAHARNPLEGQTATGLIQFTDSTARGLGISGGAPDGVLALSAEEQVPFIEKYFRRAFNGQSAKPRRVDYYAAVFMPSVVGKPLEHAIARADAPKQINGGKDNVYTLNAGMDRDRDGVIEVSDLDAVIMSKQHAAQGRFVEVTDDPLDLDPTNLGALGWAPGSQLSPLARQSLGQLCSRLPVLRIGNRGDLVAVLQFELGVSPDEIFGPRTQAALLSFQEEQQIESEVSPEGKPLALGVCGVKTWERLFARAHSEGGGAPEGAA